MLTNTNMPGAIRGAAGGYVLVEALITVLIFAIGMLGVVGLQTVALSSTSISNQRSEATVLALDMADRMRANLGSADGTPGVGYDLVTPANNGCRKVYAGSITGTPAACTTAQVAADDLQDWQDQIQQSLPGGDGDVCIDSTPNDGVAGTPACNGLGNSYAVKVFWDQRATRGVAATPMRLVVTVRP
ncbi:MAG: type pilus modification protein PilV [Pseudomonadota bacterium]